MVLCGLVGLSALVSPRHSSYLPLRKAESGVGSVMGKFGYHVRVDGRDSGIQGDERDDRMDLT